MKLVAKFGEDSLNLKKAHLYLISSWGSLRAAFSATPARRRQSYMTSTGTLGFQSLRFENMWYMWIHGFGGGDLEILKVELAHFYLTLF